MIKPTETELPVKVTFLEDDEIIKLYDEKYYIFTDEISLDDLVVLNVVINIILDSDAYEIYLKGIFFIETDDTEGNYSVLWGMSNLQYVDADIPEVLQNTAEKIMKDVIKDIFEKFSEQNYEL